MILPESPHLRAVLANASGSLSLACWIILLLPQLIEQWRLKSADGIAIGFILAWFLGDLANLFGAIIGHLRTSVILLALWFCFSDSLLIVSYLYYKHQYNDGNHGSKPSRRASPVVDVEANAQTPLLQEVSPVPTTSALNDQTSSISSVVEDRRNFMLNTFLPAVFVIVVATLSFFVSDSDGSTEVPQKNPTSSALGYISAAFYLFARIPQILQNHQRRSVEGLSMGFFALSIVGNVTYAAQVFFLRTDREWVMMYLPWLLGSLGTTVEDLVVLLQFHVYKRV